VQTTAPLFEIEDNVIARPRRLRPRRHEPDRKPRPRVAEDRVRRDTHSPSALVTPHATVSKAITTGNTTARTEEPRRSSQPLEVVRTGSIGNESLLEVSLAARTVPARLKAHGCSKHLLRAPVLLRVAVSSDQDDPGVFVDRRRDDGEDGPAL
jgi:hypothetical protein